MRHRLVALAIIVGVVVLALAALPRLVRSLTRSSPELPDQAQPGERIAEIRELRVQRAGIVSLRLAALSHPRDGTSMRVHYVLQAPLSRVQDTDIRGFLDGETRYPFNQGTSYHLRIGRRYSGAPRGEMELKRSLVKWELPDLPDGARIVAARMVFWVESFLADSPLARGEGLPLHVYAYPLRQDWSAGGGGVAGDSFSPAAPGEASWTEARTDEEAWDAPGALADASAGLMQGYRDDPLAVATIARGDRPLVLEGARLLEYISKRRSEGSTVDVLLKLDDEEEDSWGTELGLLSSDFGDDKDWRPKRPRLELEVEIPSEPQVIEKSFVLETGAEQMLPARRLSADRTLVAASVTGDSGAVAPDVWIREATVGDTTRGDWIRLVNPVIVAWDRIEAKLSGAHGRIALGEPFTVELTEPWVQPGPREAMLPELVLISPSGVLHRVDGRVVGGLRYGMEFRPDEPGLWRYGWSFRPMPVSRVGSHQGESVLFVSDPTGPESARALERYGEDLSRKLSRGGNMNRSLQRSFNTFVRWAARRARADSSARDELERAIQQARDSLERSTL